MQCQKWHHLVFLEGGGLIRRLELSERSLQGDYGRFILVNSQRQVSSFSVSHHMHEITNLWKCGLNGSSKLQENKKEESCKKKMKEKNEKKKTCTNMFL